MALALAAFWREDPAPHSISALNVHWTFLAYDRDDGLGGVAANVAIAQIWAFAAVVDQSGVENSLRCAAAPPEFCWGPAGFAIERIPQALDGGHWGGAHRTVMGSTVPMPSLNGDASYHARLQAPVQSAKVDRGRLFQSPYTEHPLNRRSIS